MAEDFLASDVSFQEAPPAAVTIPSAATNVCGMVMVTERGPIATDVLVQGPDEFSRAFGGATPNNQDGYLAMRGFFAEGGKQLHIIRTVHFTDPTDPTTKTSAAASLQLQSASGAASSGSETSANTGPYVFTNGQTVVVAVDGGGAQTFTFTGTAGSATSANGPFTLANNETLNISINGVAQPVLTFVTSEFVSIAAATAAEVVAVLNAFFAANLSGASAAVSGSAVVITSTQKGSASAVTITGGTAAAALNFTPTAGTGNVPNLAVVTASQAAAVIAPTGATVSVVSNAIKITSNTTGPSSSVQVTNASTAAIELGFDNAVHSGSSGAAANTIHVVALSDGIYANGIVCVIGAATNGDATRFKFSTQLNGAIVETFDNLSMSPTDPRYFVNVVNDANTGSPYVTLLDDNLGVRPALGSFGPLTGGSDGLAGLVDADFVGGTSLNGDVGLRSLDSVLTLALLAVPGRATPTVHNSMITYCEITRGGQVFAILDPPKNQSATQIVNYVKNTALLQNVSEYGAIYWPNILADNPNSSVYGVSATLVAPPSGALAGLFARTDAKTTAGVFQHPAGTINGQLLSARGFEMPEVKKKAKRDLVFPELINPISTEPGSPIFVDGAQTLKSTGNFPSIGQRRGVIFIETSGKQGLAFMRHQNIRPRLYADGKKALQKFLLDLCRAGAFITTDPSQAFVVDFGPGLNPPSVQQGKKVFAKISLATSPPAQWIVVEVSPDTRALDAELAAAIPIAA